MGILIKGKRMPKCCITCWAAEICRYYDRFSNCERPEHCPLVEVPEPHGRLIDADRLIKAMEERHKRLKDDDSIWEMSVVDTFLDDAPTVIEAEEQAHD